MFQVTKELLEPKYRMKDLLFLGANYRQIRYWLDERIVSGDERNWINKHKSRYTDYDLLQIKMCVDLSKCKFSEHRLYEIMEFAKRFNESKMISIDTTGQLYIEGDLISKKGSDCFLVIKNRFFDNGTHT